MVPQGAGRPLLALPLTPIPGPQLSWRRRTGLPFANVVTGISFILFGQKQMRFWSPFYRTTLRKSNIEFTRKVFYRLRDRAFRLWGSRNLENKRALLTIIFSTAASALISAISLRDGRIFGALLSSLEGRGCRHGRGGGEFERGPGVQRESVSVSGVGLQQ